MSDHTPFLTIFPGCSDMKDAAGGLDKAYVTEVQVDAQERLMSVCAWFASMPSPVDVGAISERLKEEYGLNGCGLIPDYPRPKAATAAQGGGMRPVQGGAPQGDVLYGRSIKMHPVPMNTLTLESGRVCVEGDVVAVTSRTLAKRGSAVLCFRTTTSP